ncbi:hypothetical protein [Asinibacterium sp. OR53]|uniref:hypothetical protein n=1 Tax=Asinibacterium sp. OR53 TaxID=925409 RepID=UPI0004B647B8|nr:hypothetical protein [Asinibacterium sp. OR53]
MRVNGEAIYNTRITPNYNDGAVYFTQNNTTNTRYALVCLKENESLPTAVTWHGNAPAKGATIKLLQTGEKAEWSQQGDQTTIKIPASVKKTGEKSPALVFAFTPLKNQ